MSIKRALLYGFTIAIVLFISTLLIGHLWVFIILVVSAFIGIAVSTISQSKRAGRDSTDDEQI
ncbi:MAG: hypothetical protein JKX82_02405 [Oleispira sp.]|nr:hypothetical protein [Oleispira sp.]